MAHDSRDTKINLPLELSNAQEEEEEEVLVNTDDESKIDVPSSPVVVIDLEDQEEGGLEDDVVLLDPEPRRQRRRHKTCQHCQQRFRASLLCTVPGVQLCGSCARAGATDIIKAAMGARRDASLPDFPNTPLEILTAVGEEAVVAYGAQLAQDGCQATPRLPCSTAGLTRLLQAVEAINPTDAGGGPPTTDSSRGARTNRGRGRGRRGRRAAKQPKYMAQTAWSAGTGFGGRENSRLDARLLACLQDAASQRQSSEDARLEQRLRDLDMALKGAELTAPTCFALWYHVLTSGMLDTLTNMLRSVNLADMMEQRRAVHCALFSLLATFGAKPELAALLAPQWKLKDALEEILQKTSHASAVDTSLENLPVFLDILITILGAKRQEIEETESLSEAEVYVKELRNQSYRTIEMDLGRHSFSSQARALKQAPLKRMKRIQKELAALSSSLPLSFSGSIFVRADEARPDVLKALIIGPEDTPYANGCFFFDIFLPEQYPQTPPLVQLVTTDRGHVRFNPNLYKNPYYNEPGYEEHGNKPTSQRYNRALQYQTARVAMHQVLLHTPPEFLHVVSTHFRCKRACLVAQLQAWREQLMAHPPAHQGQAGRFGQPPLHELEEVSLQAMDVVVAQVLQAVDKLKVDKEIVVL
ncbi:uncharacterized protein MONBRDRAFT_22898 [Monosiga brevicollis MX1]|uniref:UBC core domain-containing protein n=1 Tax=Monosiga brevicollis TaxID=81824 RepID=A9USE2_MONBE|nr:uncharacterized protein MONBRDRAFT_22898 [Monosiga brevicollis MX1]EDQ91765.1 predicted protein [Monosiga brevicollis MX1]|eukprot:XP_001743051.1 hypothetical protein [Monosiga brevicollis MX1]